MDLVEYLKECSTRLDLVKLGEITHHCHWLVRKNDLLLFSQDSPPHASASRLQDATGRHGREAASLPPINEAARHGRGPPTRPPAWEEEDSRNAERRRRRPVSAVELRRAGTQAPTCLLESVDVVMPHTQAPHREALGWSSTGTRTRTLV
jgi:hypothetical protein